MRVLFVTNDTMLIGGTANSLLTILDNMPPKIEKTYVLMPGRGELQKNLSERNISIIFLNYRAAWTDNNILTLQDLRQEWMNYNCAKKLAQFLIKENIDIVYTNSGIIDIGAMAAIMAGKKHIWHHREFIHQHFHKKYILEWKCRWLMQNTNVVVGVSKALVQELQRRYKIKKGVVLYNTFNKEKYYINNHQILKTEKLKCVVIGTMYEKKYQIDAILATYLVVHKYNIPMELFLVGGGDAKYMAHLNEKVVELGLKKIVHINKYINDIKAFRNDFDIEISCSQWEGFGRNVIEGMLGGLLVIGANSGATKELIKPNKNGLLYEANNCHHLAYQIKWAWNNKKEAERIARYGQQWALDRMLDDTYAESLNKIMV